MLVCRLTPGHNVIAISDHIANRHSALVSEESSRQRARDTLLLSCPSCFQDRAGGSLSPHRRALVSTSLHLSRSSVCVVSCGGPNPKWVLMRVFRLKCPKYLPSYGPSTCTASAQCCPTHHTRFPAHSTSALHAPPPFVADCRFPTTAFFC